MIAICTWCCWCVLAATRARAHGTFLGLVFILLINLINVLRLSDNVTTLSTLRLLSRCSRESHSWSFLLTCRHVTSVFTPTPPPPLSYLTRFFLAIQLILGGFSSMRKFGTKMVVMAISPMVITVFSSLNLLYVDDLPFRSEMALLVGFAVFNMHPNSVSSHCTSLHLMISNRHLQTHITLNWTNKIPKWNAPLPL